MKRFMALLLAVICMLGLICCAPTRLTFEITDAQSLTITSGTTGEIAEVTDAADIRYITDNINALTFSKNGRLDSDGWSYALRWFDGEGVMIESVTLLGDGYTIIFDDHYYKGMEIDDQIDLAFLESQFAQ